MTNSSRFLSLAVAFLGVGLASACTPSGSVQKIAYDDSVTAEPVASPATPSETPKNGDDEVIAPPETPDAPGTQDAGETVDAPEEPSEEPSQTPPENLKDRRPLHEIPGIDFGKESEESGKTGIRTTPAFSSPIYDGLRRDVTPPAFSNITHSGDGKKFSIVFTEPVTLDSVKAALTFEIFSPSQAAFVPVEGSLTASGEGDFGKFIRFNADEPVVDLDPTHVSAITFFRIRISGADSMDASRAVKDAAGNPMAHEVSLDGTCREMPAGAEYEVDCK